MPHQRLEVLIRPQHQTHWQTLERPIKHQMIASAPSESQYVICAAAMPDGTHMGKSLAELIIQQHHMASTDVRYLPRALIRHHPDHATGGICLNITALPGPLPELPPDMRSWEGRHATYLMYTAKPQQLQEFLEILMNQPPPTETEAERPVEHPTVKLGRR